MPTTTVGISRTSTSDEVLQWLHINEYGPTVALLSPLAVNGSTLLGLSEGELKDITPQGEAIYSALHGILHTSVQAHTCAHVCVFVYM